MDRSKPLALAALLVALALPSAALAQSAGDDQYLDPLAGLIGSGGSGSSDKGSGSSGSSGNSGNSGGSSTAAPTPVTSEPQAAAPVVKKSKPEAKKKPASAVDPAIDIASLNGIGQMVAIPVKHVSRVLGGIADERS